MQRDPKLWFRKSTGQWMVTLPTPHGQKQIPLGPDSDTARVHYHRMLANMGPVKGDDPQVGLIVESFLSYAKTNCKPNTFKFYESNLLRFNAIYGGLRVSELRPYHVQSWCDKIIAGVENPKNRGWNYARNLIRSVQRAMNFGIESGYIQHSPIARMRKPRALPRSTYLAPDQFAKVMGKIHDQCFRDVCIFAWETGIRGVELRQIESKHFHEDRIVFELIDSKGYARQRRVPLNETAAKIMRRLSQRYPNGPVFRNLKNRRWKSNAFVCRFSKLSDKLDFNVTMGDFRHGFATRSLNAGMNPLLLADIMGHESVDMLERYYCHVTNPAVLAELKKLGTQKEYPRPEPVSS